MPLDFRWNFVVDASIWWQRMYAQDIVQIINYVEVNYFTIHFPYVAVIYFAIKISRFKKKKNQLCMSGRSKNCGKRKKCC